MKGVRHHCPERRGRSETREVKLLQGQLSHRLCEVGSSVAALVRAAGRDREALARGMKTHRNLPGGCGKRGAVDSQVTPFGDSQLGEGHEVTGPFFNTSVWGGGGAGGRGGGGDKQGLCLA